MSGFACLPSGVPSFTACAEDVAGRDLGDPEGADQPLRLRPLPRARRSEQDEVHELPSRDRYP